MGIDSNYFSEKSPVVARVDGHKITQADWDNAHREENGCIRAQSPMWIPNSWTPPSALCHAGATGSRPRVCRGSAELAPDHQRRPSGRALQDIPAIAALKRPDGSLDTEAYRSLVGAKA